MAQGRWGTPVGEVKRHSTSMSNNMRELSLRRQASRNNQVARRLAAGPISNGFVTLFSWDKLPQRLTIQSYKSAASLG